MDSAFYLESSSHPCKISFSWLMTPQGRGLGKGQRTTECPLLGVSSRISLRGLSGLLLALAAADLGLPQSPQHILCFSCPAHIIQYCPQVYTVLSLHGKNLDGQGHNLLIFISSIQGITPGRWSSSEPTWVQSSKLSLQGHSTRGRSMRLYDWWSGWFWAVSLSRTHWTREPHPHLPFLREVHLLPGDNQEPLVLLTGSLVPCYMDMVIFFF